jgi:RNA recognition motif-containing protein
MTNDASRERLFLLKIGNLSYRTTDMNLYNKCKAHGCIGVSLALTHDGLSKGRAIAKFRTAEAARTAYAALNQVEFEGRTLIIDAPDDILTSHRPSKPVYEDPPQEQPIRRPLSAFGPDQMPIPRESPLRELRDLPPTREVPVQRDLSSPRDAPLLRELAVQRPRCVPPPSRSPRTDIIYEDYRRDVGNSYPRPPYDAFPKRY